MNRPKRMLVENIAWSREVAHSDARFFPLTERAAHLEELYELIEAVAPTHSNAEWVAFCDDVSIPCMPVLSLDQLPDDEHMRAVGMFGQAEHPTRARTRPSDRQFRSVHRHSVSAAMRRNSASTRLKS